MVCTVRNTMKSILVASSGVGEAQVQLTAALDDLFQQLIDRVLVAVGEARHRAANLLADAAHEARRRRVLGVLRRVGEEVPEIAVVEVGMVEAVVLALPPVVLARAFCEARERVDLALAISPSAACARARASSGRHIRACAGPAIRRTACDHIDAGPARRRMSRRSLRRDGSARTSDRDAARSSCCRASACSTRGMACRASRRAGGAWDAGEAGRRCRWHGRLRGAGSSGTHSGSPPSTSSICVSSSRASRGCAR